MDCLLIVKNKGSKIQKNASFSRILTAFNRLSSGAQRDFFKKSYD
jgi:hypothetical protein